MGKECIVTTERRFVKWQGKYFSSGMEDSSFFQRYSAGFDKVNVLARVVIAQEKPNNLREVKISGRFYDLSTSPVRSVFELLLLNISEEVVCITRTPGLVSFISSAIFTLKKKKIALEVVADPIQEAAAMYESFLKKNLVKVFYEFFFRFQIRSCIAASFVTKLEIQKSYDVPIKKEYSFSYSSIEVDNIFFPRARDVWKSFENKKNRCGKELIFIGELSRNFKGLDVLLRALLLIDDEGLTLKVVGDGKLLPHYKRMVEEFGLASRVVFIGAVYDKKEKFHLLRNADLLVLPSKREGLPRVIIESLIVGLPSICSDVCGARELLPSEYIFKMSCHYSLKNKLEDVLCGKLSLSKGVMHALSTRESFRKESLVKERTAFYKYLSQKV